MTKFSTVRNSKIPICRIVIIGNAAGGKTTLSQQIGKTLSIPVFHIDDSIWDTSWEHKPAEIFHKEHKRFMKLDNWVIDGIGIDHEDEIYQRLHKANIIVFVDFPIEEHLRLTKEREKTPIATAPAGCSYKGMFKRISDTVKRLNTTLIPKLRIDIPNIAKTTGATVYTVKQIEEMPNILEKIISTINHYDS